ncbi:hypothetical protein EV426DRAFT_704817 [Tirmania nivea]|nr:hypothetical protein EV426DRAFT_704817 [Tirmania nivea]
MHHGGLTIADRTNEHSHFFNKLIHTKTTQCHPPKARMCHTLTKIDENIHLLFGGRTAPTRVLADTWLYDGGIWKQWQHSGEQWRIFASGRLFPGPRFRHCAVADKARKEVLVFGGIGEGNEVLGDWHVFSLEKQTWSQLRVTNAQGSTDGVAIMIGGIDESQNVLNDMWKVMWTGTEGVVEQVTLHPQTKQLLGRFGAQLVKMSDSELSLIGGVSGGPLMRALETIVTIDIRKDIRVTCAYEISLELPPLLVGFTVGLMKSTLVLAGGRAVCFSLGAEWNANVLAVSRGADHLEALIAQTTAQREELITESPTISARKSEGCQATDAHLH